ncbi:hypothetical protein F4553_001952 [Allocatelliglobosispora scoriae]|uniref:Uncharacterized protein n=1 Tax=Allocatelliglobosispora scoriae TaxID=643052 RepID=A0A841BNP1_9ACTN|nr:hypothetical protein [Allocatelliglobosispora scoriae]MBB5868573.1 hypothetical protein [Allocatelliglobosispora scoriae]
MTRPRLFATATLTAPFPILLLTAALQHAPHLRPTALLAAILLTALGAAFVYRHRTDAADRTVARLGATSPALGVAFTAVTCGAFLALELATLALADRVLRELSTSPTPPRWPIAALWLTAVVLGWSRWRTGVWPLARLLLPALGVALWLWAQAAVGDRLAVGLLGDRWPVRAGIGGLLLLVLLAGTLAYSGGEPQRRITNQITTGACAVILALGYLGAVLESFRRLGPGPVLPAHQMAEGESWTTAGPTGFDAAEAAVSGVYRVFGTGIVHTTTDLWLWPVLAAFTAAVVLFGRAATDRIDALGLAATPARHPEDLVRVHSHRVSRLAHTLLSGGLLLLVVTRPESLHLAYLAFAVGTVGIAFMASLTLIAVGVARLDDTGTLPRTQCGALLGAAAVPAGAAVCLLPQVLGWSWSTPRLWAVSGGYLAVAAAAALGSRWLPNHAAHISRALAGPQEDVYHWAPQVVAARWETRDGYTVGIGDEISVTEPSGETLSGVIEAVDHCHGWPVMRTRQGPEPLRAVQPRDILTPTRTPAGAQA